MPVAAQVQMLQWLLFNTLIGNSNAHAKNLSFLVDARGLRIAPLYDLVCGSVYDHHNIAQSVGGETIFAVISKAKWMQLAKNCGVPFNLLQQLTRQLTKQTDAAQISCLQNPENIAIRHKFNWNSLPK